MKESSIDDMWVGLLREASFMEPLKLACLLSERLSVEPIRGPKLTCLLKKRLSAEIVRLKSLKLHEMLLPTELSLVTGLVFLASLVSSVGFAKEAAGQDSKPRAMACRLLLFGESGPAVVLQVESVEGERSEGNAQPCRFLRSPL